MRYEDIPKKATWAIDAFALHRKTLLQVVGEIDDMLEKYAQAHTQMARNNLLADLNKSCSALKLTCKLPNPALNALLDIVKRKLQFQGVIRKYDNVVCVSYSVTTGNFEALGSGSTVVKYQGMLDDGADMLARVRTMKLAVNQARGLVPVAQLNDKKTLKIFMAPEFYFRGRYGAYTPDVVSQIMPLLRAGNDGTGRSKFDDWLIVFGTAISAAVNVTHYCITCKSDKDVSFDPDPMSVGKTKARCANGAGHDVQEGNYGATVDNVALIQKGKLDHLIAKQYMSGIDFRDKGPGGYVRIMGHPGLDKLRARHDSDFTPSKFQDERMGGGIFNIDGITIGMEVCLDHAMDKLKGGKNLQIVLIPSAGMDIKKLKTIMGGVTFNVDGLRSDGIALVRSGGGLTHGPNSINRALVGIPGNIRVFDSVPIPYL